MSKAKPSWRPHSSITTIAALAWSVVSSSVYDKENVGVVGVSVSMSSAREEVERLYRQHSQDRRERGVFWDVTSETYCLRDGVFKADFH